ncbi:MAG TPA: sigma 54-interacting transcriptional regulator [Chitinispirillaceae bacterium]|nr:sigma 54-interacting transcriptional regulator [Chitinispirillaceae bacterium]
MDTGTNIATKGICLVCRENSRIYQLSERVITIGSSSECSIPVNVRPADTFAVQLLFAEGAYTVQQLSPGIRLMVNNKKVKNSSQLVHGDIITVGELNFEYREAVDQNQNASGNNPLFNVIKILASLIRNRDQDLSEELVASVARLLSCDASRLVVWDEASQKHTTIATFPSNAPSDRFSKRAIEWARTEKKAILMQDFDWREDEGQANSLETNSVSSIICTQLNGGEDILGFLYLDRMKGRKQFDNSDKQLCDALAPLFSEILINARERQNQARTIARLQELKTNGVPGFIYQSESMKDVIKQANTFAPTNAPVLIFGETGTGKELMARFIHQQSTRAQKPFRAINCGAIPANLIESELFGYEKGAFTGAVKRTEGLFEVTNGGTVFLDEIGEMPLDIQVKLLRVLQESEITRLGGHDPITVDVRIIAATNRDLAVFVKESRFRQDLYFRLNVLSITIPPLRSRDHDIIVLAEYFIDCYCQQFGLEHKKLSAQAHAALLSYQWPGNVRELENKIQKAILLSTQNRIEEQFLFISQSDCAPAQQTSQNVQTLKEIRVAAEKKGIEDALGKTAGNISMASKLLDIDRAWLTKRINEYQIDADQYRGQ